MLDQSQLKQRIIGGIVLVSLATILVPFLMDDPHQEVKILESNVPPWPEDQPLSLIEISEEEFSPIVEPIAQESESPRVLEKPQKPPAIKPVVVEKKSEPVSDPVVKAPVQKTEKKKATVSVSGGKQWEVQVVSYSKKSRKRAERFQQRMEKRGYTVLLKENNKQIRLVTAPVGSSKEAKKLKKQIDRDFRTDKVKSMVRLLK